MTIENQLRKLGLRRTTKLPVGKQMGSQVWFHVSYAEQILSQDELRELKRLQNLIQPDVVRLCLKSRELVAIECKGFDSLPEPIIQRTVSSDKDSKIKIMGDNPPIYHSKWMFVQDDYQNFSVSTSKLRSIEWKSRLGVNRSISSRIGRSTFWNDWLETMGLMPNK
ncbi:hypothetical protein [Vibrio owensii]|uniref:hypothetical protein n=1 Tax=Vibrio owensii TaxID=696485 RepID=UPI003CC693B5